MWVQAVRNPCHHISNLQKELAGAMGHAHRHQTRRSLR